MGIFFVTICKSDKKRFIKISFSKLSNLSLPDSSGGVLGFGEKLTLCTLALRNRYLAVAKFLRKTFIFDGFWYPIETYKDYSQLKNDTILKNRVKNLIDKING